MNWIKDLFDVFYTKFLLRDILAKVVPGFLFLAALLRGAGLFQFIDAQFYLIVIVYGLSFAIGIFLQTFASMLGIVKIHVWPSEGKKTAMGVSLNKLKIFLKENKDNQEILAQRERLVIIKNMAGTYAALVLILTVFGVVHFFFTPIIGLAPIGVLVFYILLNANKHHAEEQRIWEKINIAK